MNSTRSETNTENIFKSIIDRYDKSLHTPQARSVVGVRGTTPLLRFDLVVKKLLFMLALLFNDSCDFLLFLFTNAEVHVIAIESSLQYETSYSSQ